MVPVLIQIAFFAGSLLALALVFAVAGLREPVMASAATLLLGMCLAASVHFVSIAAWPLAAFFVGVPAVLAAMLVVAHRHARRVGRWVP